MSNGLSSKLIPHPQQSAKRRKENTMSDISAGMYAWEQRAGAMVLKLNIGDGEAKCEEWKSPRKFWRKVRASADLTVRLRKGRSGITACIYDHFTRVAIVSITPEHPSNHDWRQLYAVCAALSGGMPVVAVLGYPY